LANAFGLKTSCCAITKTLTYVKYASTLCFACATFLAPKSLRQIGNSRFFRMNSESVYEPLMLEVRFLLGTETAIDSLLSPLRGTPAAYLNAPLACFLAYVEYVSTRRFACATFLAPKSLRQIGNSRFFRTNSGGVYEPLSWEVRFFIGNGEGIEVLAKPIFVRGVSPFYGSGTAAPFHGRRILRPLHFCA